eukprot:4081481-Ditylum_brightwellii.AAC.1
MKLPLAALRSHLCTKDVCLQEHVPGMNVSQKTYNLKHHPLRILVRFTKNTSSHKHQGASHFLSEKY